MDIIHDFNKIFGSRPIDTTMEEEYREELKKENYPLEELFNTGIEHLDEGDYGRARSDFYELSDRSRKKDEICSALASTYLELAEAGASNRGLNGDAIWTQNGRTADCLQKSLNFFKRYREGGQISEEQSEKYIPRILEFRTQVTKGSRAYIYVDNFRTEIKNQTS